VTDNPLIFTDNAAAKVWELIAEEGNYELKLRVYVTGGGCSGFQYGFSFDSQINDDDTIINKPIDKLQPANDSVYSVQVLIDSVSVQYLLGSEIDYVDDISGGQFIIRNPNAKTTCGCGSSFTVDD
jgi:iron-sulfur cluster insertion protein